MFEQRLNKRVFKGDTSSFANNLVLLTLYQLYDGTALTCVNYWDKTEKL